MHQKWCPGVRDCRSRFIYRANLEAYYQVAKENGADTEFLKDMNLVVQEIKDFQQQEPDRVRIPKLNAFEIEK